MILNEYGQIIDNIWNEMSQHYPFVVLHNYVVMPNHFHGVVEITNYENAEYSNNAQNVGDGRGAIYRAHIINRALNDKCALNDKRAINSDCAQNNDNAIDNVGVILQQGAFDNKGAINRAPTRTVGGFAGDKNPMLHNNLSRLIRWFKGRTTFECRKIEPYFAWQRNLWEHVIRDFDDYARIADYINANPANWQSDDFYC